MTCCTANGSLVVRINELGKTIGLLQSRGLKYAIVFAVVMAFTLEFGVSAFGQRGAGAGTRRNLTLMGDVKIDESQVTDRKPLTLDVILYTKGGEVVGRQKLGNNGRYRFINIFNGEYDIVIEIENSEVARIPVVVAGGTQSSQYPDDIRKDIELVWRPGPSLPAKPVTISAEDAYDRRGPSKNLFERAQGAFDKKEHEKAVDLFTQVVTGDPEDFQAWSELGTVYLATNKLADAEKAYQRATEIRPKFFLALFNLGRVRVKQKNFEGAIAALEQALVVKPASAEVNYFLGDSYLQIKKGSKAVGYLNEALKLEPIKMAEAHLRLGMLYDAAGYKDRAVAEYEQFLKKKADYPDRKKLEQYIAANKKSQ